MACSHSVWLVNSPSTYYCRKNSRIYPHDFHVCNFWLHSPLSAQRDHWALTQSSFNEMHITNLSSAPREFNSHINMFEQFLQCEPHLAPLPPLHTIKWALCIYSLIWPQSSVICLWVYKVNKSKNTARVTIQILTISSAHRYPPKRLPSKFVLILCSPTYTPSIMFIKRLLHWLQILQKRKKQTEEMKEKKGNYRYSRIQSQTTSPGNQRNSRKI